MPASLILFLYPIGRGQAPSSASISSTADANAHNRSFIPESAGHLISSTIFLAVDGKVCSALVQLIEVRPSFLETNITMGRCCGILK
ncbi:hypothetical protein ZIOFF_065984 [Zingiber officinale]|uniref:Uncharacterized protein n=1 Tax=Zingiber officinale TaxID=94328 RepID=A0A8J5EXZ0_ZINOF|nr:hypothetical protein ZIOFF_065984 [Zingiber officinale]